MNSKELKEYKEDLVRKFDHISDEVRLIVECFGKHSTQDPLVMKKMYNYYIERMDDYHRYFMHWITHIKHDDVKFKWDYYVKMSKEIIVYNIKKKYGKDVKIPWKDLLELDEPFCAWDRLYDRVDSSLSLDREEFSNYRKDMRILSLSPRARVEYIKEHTNMYINKLSEFYSLFIESFTNHGTIDISQIEKYVSYIGVVKCGDGLYEDYKPTSFHESGSRKSVFYSYPFLNATGSYTITEYVYAFCNGVIIYGAPSSISMADEKLKCPNSFIKHDFDHSDDMEEEILPDMEALSVVYNKAQLIENSIERRLTIYMFWFTIHEINLHPREDANKIYKTSLDNDVNAIFVPEVIDDIETYDFTRSLEDLREIMRDDYPKEVNAKNCTLVILARAIFLMKMII